MKIEKKKQDKTKKEKGYTKIPCGKPKVEFAAAVCVHSAHGPYIFRATDPKCCLSCPIYNTIAARHLHMA